MHILPSRELTKISILLLLAVICLKTPHDQAHFNQNIFCERGGGGGGNIIYTLFYFKKSRNMGKICFLKTISGPQDMKVQTFLLILFLGALT